MGDPKIVKKKYTTPIHPWQKDRIEEEKALIKEYGLKNKKEIWKMESLLKNFKAQAKKLVVSQSEQSEKEKENLLKRLYKLGLLEEGRGLPSVLEIGLRDVLERRLQTQVVRKGVARTVKQARQMITHSHVMVNDIKIDSPGYLISKEEESISFAPNSNFSDIDHPERPGGEAKPKLSKGKQEVEKTSAPKKIEKPAEESPAEEPAKEVKEEKPKEEEKAEEEKKEEAPEDKKEEEPKAE